MKKYGIYLMALVATIGGSHIASAQNMDDGYQHFLRRYPLTLEDLPRSGINRSLPKIEYNLNDVFQPKASLVEVLGVVEVKGKPQAMIKIKNQPFGSVEVGDKLFDGNVTVKEISIAKGNIGSSFITLEEDGFLVSRLVGEQAISGSNSRR